MAEEDYRFQDPRAQGLVDQFQRALRYIAMTDGARRLLETYFYANYGKFALSGQLGRLLRHWELSFQDFVKTLTERSYAGQIDAEQMRNAIISTAEIYYRARGVSQDDIKAEEKIPPPKW
jgi:hypothetical protein